MMITIDGNLGEGGGQILRTSLSLSATTGVPVRIVAIRRGRKKPGLLRQHLTAVQAIAAVCNARVTGAELGSSTIVFEPGKVRHQSYKFSVGTAGSATLVFQTVLPALLMTDGESRIVFEGGTHNAWAPPFEFIAHTFLPLLRRMGAEVDVELERPGFYPAGGGRFTAQIKGRSLGSLHLCEHSPVKRILAQAVVSRIPKHVAEREVQTLMNLLSDLPITFETACVESAGPGNVAMVRIETNELTEILTGFGERGIKAETVAAQLAGEVRKHLTSGGVVGEHLADQLLIPLVLGSGGSLITAAPSLHTTTNLKVIEQFFPDVLTSQLQPNGTTKIARV